MKQKKLGVAFASVITILMLSAIAIATTEVDVDFDVGAGDVAVDVSNNEAQVGFHGVGGWTGNMNSIETGNYLDTDVLVESTAGANFNFGGFQKLSGYTDNKVAFESFASGSNALMNNRFDNSNYVVQLERVTSSKDFLSANGNSYGIGWQMQIQDPTAYSSAGISAQLFGDGSGAFDTNQWHSTATGNYGWGNPDGINSPNPAGYYTPQNTVTATGTGVFDQAGWGDNSLEFNGFNAGSGSGSLNIGFSGGLTGTYNVRSN